MPAPQAPAKPPAPRGRPRTITDARIVAAGMQMTLPRITLTGVAALLGISHIALYKHVANVDALKRMVADAIFTQWQAPDVAASESLEGYLAAFAESLRALVAQHPGLVPYLVQRDAKSPEMIRRIQAHHRELSQRFEVPPLAARWLMSTVAFHGVALADTVYSASAMAGHADAAPSSAVDAAQLDAEYRLSMRALIVGALALYHNGELPG